MIITRLFGGLGNQLFQYAAGRALADHLGTDLALDRRYVQHDSLAHFARARFTEQTALPPSKMDNKLRYGLWRAFGRQPRFRRERQLGFDPGFFSLRDNSYLQGYWQSERYFSGISRLVRQDLTMTTPLNNANQAMAQRISDTGPSVALHVRRGDYLNTPNHPTCPPEYYQRAIAHLRETTTGDLTCFVFSDDPEWAQAHLDLERPTHVVALNTAEEGHFDLHLQTLCSHNIIANSTFSWWGAWLNANPDKQVIAPARWFAPNHPDNPDICPDGWTRL